MRNNLLLVTRLIDNAAEPCILVINGELLNPAGIFVHNNHTIFWTNYRQDTAFVGTIQNNMITNQKQLQGGFFQYPNGIFFDGINSKLYWVNQGLDNRPAPLGTGNIYVGSFSDNYISDYKPLSIASDYMCGPNGIFIDQTKSPTNIYWTNYMNDTMYVGDLSDTIVSNVLPLIVPELSDFSFVYGPSSLFIDVLTRQIYWTNYENYTAFTGYLEGTVISDIHPITGPNFNGPNGIFITQGTLDDDLLNVCDVACPGCNELFIQFSDLSKSVCPLLDLETSDHRRLLTSALSLQQSYCLKIDWRNSSNVAGSARALMDLLYASDDTLDPLMREFKHALLSNNSEEEFCDLIP